MSKELDAFLSSYSREAREIVLCLRDTVLGTFGDAEEKVDSKAKLITYKMGGLPEDSWVCAIAPHMKHVNLIFSQGAELPDYSGLLVGTGKEARHVRLKSEEETQTFGLQTLLEEAKILASKTKNLG